MKLTERMLRTKFCNEVTAAGPEVLLGQYVNLTINGPAYKVLELKKLENGMIAARLDKWKGSAWFNGSSQYGWVALASLNYFSGDCINLHKGRMDSIIKNMTD
jgi:hypothetical protein